jgi:UDP-N-acetylglucosamine--N-acetylmuramyl-(pentapeptide) pyrophosphoryl-undecaprenol N-acetylglucosamine transferase
MKRILISGGGTSGHINPALSIAECLHKHNWEIHYIGNNNSLEERLVSKAGYKFYPINIQKIYRRFTFAHLKFPVKLILSVLKSLAVINRIKPQVYLGTGGFVSGPAGIAAMLSSIPICLQEQNSYPGITTRYLARWSQYIFLGNKKAAAYLPVDKTRFTGNPVNPGIISPTPDFIHKYPSLTPGRKKIFLLGGSQGSLRLNEAFSPIIEELLAADLEIIWQTGEYSHHRFSKLYAGRKGIYLFSYSHNMPDLYHLTDLVICRAGALSLAEIETLNIPALIVPLPTAAENHQYYNALEMVQKGSAEIIEQKDLTPHLLLEKVLNMIENLKVYKTASAEILHQHAAENIAAVINELYGGNNDVR